MPGPLDLVEQALQQIREEASLQHLDERALERLRQIIGEAIAGENEACMVTLWNATEGQEREALMDRFQEIDHLAHRDSFGNPIPSNLATRFWTCWYPGLEIDDRCVADVLGTLPGFQAEDVPAIIRAFENPASPLKLPGACTLRQHDVIHVLVGRGLVDQDEAFVLGFTAATDPEFSDLDIERYKLAFSLYPEPYCIRGCDLTAFDLGVEAARSMSLASLRKIDPDALLRMTVGEARSMLGIDKEKLYAIYAKERAAIPGTPWSNRLPTRRFSN